MREIDEERQDTTNLITKWEQLLAQTQVHFIALGGNVELLYHCMLKVEDHAQIVLRH